MFWVVDPLGQTALVSVFDRDCAASVKTQAFHHVAIHKANDMILFAIPICLDGFGNEEKGRDGKHDDDPKCLGGVRNNRRRDGARDDGNVPCHVVHSLDRR